MNTSELKKLAEAVSVALPQLANMEFDSFAEVYKLRSRFRSEAPAAILKLLAINAELVDRLKWIKENPHVHQVNLEKIIDATLAKAEGGEL